MSDVKPRRSTREAAKNETARTAAAPNESEPAITPMIAAAPEPELALPKPPVEPMPEPAATADDPWAAFGEAQAALARGFEEIAAEVAGATRSGIAAAAEAAVALIGARTVAEAIEINAGLARRGADTMIEASARLSEIGIKSATEASRPLLAQFAGFGGSPLAG